MYNYIDQTNYRKKGLWMENQQKIKTSLPIVSIAFSNPLW